MPSAGGARTADRAKEQSLAFRTGSPIELNAPNRIDIEQLYIFEAVGLIVLAARRADAFLWQTREMHALAFRAGSPTGLNV